MRLSNTFGRDRALLDQLDEIICGYVHLYFIEAQWYWGGKSYELDYFYYCVVVKEKMSKYEINTNNRKVNEPCK